MDKKKRMKLLSKKARQATNKSCAQCAVKKETSNAVKVVLVPFHSALDAVSQQFWEPSLSGWMIPVCEGCHSVFKEEMNSSTPETRFSVISKWITPLIN